MISMPDCNGLFQEEYEDKDTAPGEKPAATADKASKQTSLIAASDRAAKPVGTTSTNNASVKLQSNLDDLLGICDSIEGKSSATDPLLNLLDQSDLFASDPNPKATAMSNFSFDLFGKLNKSASAYKANADKSTVSKSSKATDKKASAWFDLFADLDPLANPAAMEQKIAGANKNYLDA